MLGCVWQGRTAHLDSGWTGACSSASAPGAPSGCASSARALGGSSGCSYTSRSTLLSSPANSADGLRSASGWGLLLLRSRSWSGRGLLLRLSGRGLLLRLSGRGLLLRRSGRDLRLLRQPGGRGQLQLSGGLDLR